MNVFTGIAGFDQKDWSKSEYTFSFFGKRELVDLGSKHTSTTAKVAVYAAIILSSCVFTPFIAIPMYLAYDLYLHEKGIRVIDENNLNWVHERYFGKSEQKREDAKCFLEKLKASGILQAHTFIENASENAVKEVDNLFRLYDAGSLEALGGILQDQDKQAIRDLFQSNKEKAFPKWAQLLMQFIAQSAEADDPEAKAAILKAFSDFYAEFSPLSQKRSGADEAILSLFSDLLEKAPKYSAACAIALKNGDLESTYSDWQTLFQDNSFAPQALAEVAVPDISKVQERAKELKSLHLKSHLIEKYGSYFYSYVEGKITEADQKISLSELAKELFSDADTNTASAIKKELFLNGKFDVTEKEIIALIEASNRLARKHVVKSAQVVAIMFCCGRPAERIFEYAKAVVPKANRETHKAYMAAVSLVQNTHSLETLLTHFEMADKDLQEVSSVEKLQLLQFLEICQSKEVEVEVVKQLVEENAHKRLLPLQEETQARHLVDELIDLKLAQPSSLGDIELTQSDKKLLKEKHERDAYWLLVQLLPSILSPGSRRVAKAFSLPTEQSMPQMLDDFQKSYHRQPVFREMMRNAFSGELLKPEKIKEVLDTVKNCIPSETNSRQAANTFVDARFQEIYEKLDPENQLIFSSIMANKDRIHTDNFAIDLGARTLIESTVKVTAELMLARNASQNLPASIYQGIATNLHRIASYGSVSAIKIALRAYSSPYNPFRKTINDQIAKRIFASLQTPFVRAHFERNGEKMIEAIADALPSLCDKLELEGLLGKLKAYDQALSSQNLGQATKALLDFSDVLTGENSALKEIGARCLNAILKPEAAQSSKQIDEESDSSSVAETEISWDTVSEMSD